MTGQPDPNALLRAIVSGQPVPDDADPDPAPRNDDGTFAPRRVPDAASGTGRRVPTERRYTTTELLQAALYG